VHPATGWAIGLREDECQLMPGFEQPDECALSE